MLTSDLKFYPFPPKTSDEEKIIFARTRGYSFRQIQDAFGYGNSKMTRVWSQYQQTKSVPPSLSRGPHSKLTPDTLMNIQQIVSQNAHSTLHSISRTLLEKHDISISKSTVENGLRLLRYYYKPPKHRQLLTELQKTNRIIFAQTLLNQSFHHQIDLQTIVFSDESRFVLGDDKQWVWRRYGENNPTSILATQKFPPSVMIFGAIGKDFKSKLVIVDGTINSEVYQQIIMDSKLVEIMDDNRGRGNWIFMQDGARSHTSKCTQNFLSKKCRYIQKWPPNSPDLNPIETLWGAMKKAVSQIKPKTVEDLKVVIQKVWDDFPQENINNLVESFYQRLHLIIGEKGESIQSYIRKGLNEMCFVSLPNFNNFDLLDDVISILQDESNDQNSNLNNESTLEPIILSNDIGTNIDLNFSDKINQTALNENDSNFTKEDDKIIFDLYMKYGPKWTMMTKYLPKKSANLIKNRFRNQIQKAIKLD